MTMSDNGELQVLDAIFNADTVGFPAGNPYVQLHTGDPGEAGTTNVASIARVQADFGVASAGTLSNSANIDFTSMPAITTPGVVGWSIWDAAGSGVPPTGANCFWTGWFSTVGRVFVNVLSASTDLFSSAAHGFVADDRVVFETIEGETLPAGVTAGTLYWVISTSLATDTFLVSTTQGGGALAITGNGGGMVRKVVGKTTNSGDTFRIAAAALSIFID
jgi:hypothetical protein